MPHCPVCWWIM
uniref:Uncharacterized protein n=1 Tax=Vitis vinifera TaxID=29760 RepID=F6HU65_VITVI